MESTTIWVPIEGYEGLYEVSDGGDVRSLDRISSNGHTLSGVFLKQHDNAYGYMIVRLTKNGKAKTYSVHRLVAQAFVPNPLGLSFVNHRDEDKTNNCASNLEWCTRSYNNSYGTRPAKISKANRENALNGRLTGLVPCVPILQFTLDGKFVARYSSIREAARHLGKNRGSQISLAASGHNKTAYGYRWFYESDFEARKQA